MNAAYIVGTFDVAELAFLLFFGFFIALVFYLNRESRREGYPLEDEDTGEIHRTNVACRLLDLKTNQRLLQRQGELLRTAIRAERLEEHLTRLRRSLTGGLGIALLTTLTGLTA